MNYSSETSTLPLHCFVWWHSDTMRIRGIWAFWALHQHFTFNIYISEKAGHSALRRQQRNHISYFTNDKVDIRHGASNIYFIHLLTWRESLLSKRRGSGSPDFCQGELNDPINKYYSSSLWAPKPLITTNKVGIGHQFFSISATLSILQWFGNQIGDAL